MKAAQYFRILGRHSRTSLQVVVVPCESLSLGQSFGRNLDFDGIWDVRE